MTEACPDCGDSFEKVGLHWSRGSCNYPTPDGGVDDILTGLYMGDGSLAAHDSKNPYMRWNNTNKRFLEYVDSRLRWLSTGVRLRKSAEESAQQRLDRDQEGWTVDPENFNPIYATRTRRLPYFRKFKRWTETSQKRYPDDLDLTPTVASIDTLVMGQSTGCEHTLQELRLHVGMNRTESSSCSVYSTEQGSK